MHFGNEDISDIDSNLRITYSRDVKIRDFTYENSVESETHKRHRDEYYPGLQKLRKEIEYKPISCMPALLAVFKNNVVFGRPPDHGELSVVTECRDCTWDVLVDNEKLFNVESTPYNLPMLRDSANYSREKSSIHRPLTVGRHTGTIFNHYFPNLSVTFHFDIKAGEHIQYEIGPSTK
jgi:hypothetical protein